MIARLILELKRLDIDTSEYEKELRLIHKRESDIVLNPELLDKEEAERQRQTFAGIGEYRYSPSKKQQAAIERKQRERQEQEEKEEKERASNVPSSAEPDDASHV